MNDCNHELIWTEIVKPNKVIKYANCDKCGEILDAVVKEMGKSEVDKNQIFYDGMFKCIDVVKKEHPEFTDEVTSHYAISLFIQIARR